MAGEDDEKDHALDWAINPQPNHRCHGQCHGSEQAGLTADASEKHEGDEHAGWGEHDHRSGHELGINPGAVDDPLDGGLNIHDLRYIARLLSGASLP
jgi:hypothetical protein